MPDFLVNYLDQAAVDARQYQWLNDPDTRKRLHGEDEVVRALVKVAGRAGVEERAVLPNTETRSDDENEAARIARDHGFSDDRLIAMKGLPAAAVSGSTSCCGLRCVVSFGRS